MTNKEATVAQAARYIQGSLDILRAAREANKDLFRGDVYHFGVVDAILKYYLDFHSSDQRTACQFMVLLASGYGFKLTYSRWETLGLTQRQAEVCLLFLESQPGKTYRLVKKSANPLFKEDQPVSEDNPRTITTETDHTSSLRTFIKYVMQGGSPSVVARIEVRRLLKEPESYTLDIIKELYGILRHMDAIRKGN